MAGNSFESGSFRFVSDPRICRDPDVTENPVGNASNANQQAHQDQDLDSNHEETTTSPLELSQSRFPKNIFVLNAAPQTEEELMEEREETSKTRPRPSIPLFPAVDGDSADSIALRYKTVEATVGRAFHYLSPVRGSANGGASPLTRCHRSQHSPQLSALSSLSPSYSPSIPTLAASMEYRAYLVSSPQD